MQGVDPYRERRIVLGGLSEHLSTIRRGRRIMFCGCGTSYHAAMACRQACAPTSPKPRDGDYAACISQPSRIVHYVWRTRRVLLVQAMAPIALDCSWNMRMHPPSQGLSVV